MRELRSYPRHLVPRDFAIQIRSYARIQWPYVQGQGNEIWDFTARENNPLHFILYDNEVVISHASVNHRPVEFQGETLNCWGLSTVFTYPAFRKGGFASQLVRAATEHIQKSQADLAMLFCGHPLRQFYSTAGWTPMDTARVFYGDEKNPTAKIDNLVMML